MHQEFAVEMQNVLHVITFRSVDVPDKLREIRQRNVFIWNVTITATAVHQMRASIISASIPALFRTFADTVLIVRRLIIAQYAPVNLAAQVIRILDALRFNIVRAIHSVQLVQYAMEGYAQRSVEVQEIALAINSVSMGFVSLPAEVILVVQNINTAIITYVFKNYVVRQTTIAHTMKNASRIILDRRSVAELAT